MRDFNLNRIKIILKNIKINKFNQKMNLYKILKIVKLIINIIAANKTKKS